MYYGNYANISEMVGKTFTSVYQNGDNLIFKNEEGEYVFYHSQDCCENVGIEDIVGELSDLENNPLLMAEEETNRTDPPTGGYTPDSYTWTYYKFATIKGYVTVRWYGESNGYYSEEVSLRFNK